MKQLELKFLNEEEKIVTYSLDKPDESVEADEVAEAMDEIIDQNVFETTGGELVKKDSARIVERNVEEIELP